MAGLTHDEAVKVMLDAGFDPIGPYPGWHTAWPCYCTRAGHAVSQALASVARGGSCRVCAHRVPLTAAQADQELIRAGLSRLGPWVNVRTPVRCRCQVCGAEVAPRLSSIRDGQGGCNSCSQRARMLRRHAEGRVPPRGYHGRYTTKP